jgi:hypothetical protein
LRFFAATALLNSPYVLTLLGPWVLIKRRVKAGLTAGLSAMAKWAKAGAFERRRVSPGLRPAQNPVQQEQTEETEVLFSLSLLPPLPAV